MTTLAHIMQGLGQTSSLPLYQQLQRALREAIDKRILGPDEALPAERQLASDLAVSRITVRKAIDGLVNEGLLVRRPGSGNFINTRIEKNFAKLTSFSEDMRARGRTPRSVWLKRSEGTVTPEE
ncbi:MAG: GntR family transcriptional regulator, partial [Janthinobacterium sp.]